VDHGVNEGCSGLLLLVELLLDVESLISAFSSLDQSEQVGESYICGAHVDEFKA
jgi:hypothetical protein